MVKRHSILSFFAKSLTKKLNPNQKFKIDFDSLFFLAKLQLFDRTFWQKVQ